MIILSQDVACTLDEMRKEETKDDFGLHFCHLGDYFLLTFGPGLDNVFKNTRIINPAFSHKTHCVFSPRFEPFNDVESLRRV